MQKIAFFVDGGYFVRRIKYYHRKFFQGHALEPQNIVSIIYNLVRKHQENLARDELYRIYYYDAPPLEKQVRYPRPAIGHHSPGTWNSKREPGYLFQTELHKQLKASRKLALRMGKLSNSGQWQVRDRVLSQLLANERQFSDLTNDDFYYSVQQKGVDTRIGVDITTVTLNQYADTIVLLASDADFVPAAKLARTHGVDVVLDPLWGNVDSDLQTHIDGKKSFDLVNQLKNILGHEPEPRPSWWTDMT
ncbi:MAG: NYN domain-containing protein [Endozoicomonas sp.]